MADFIYEVCLLPRQQALTFSDYLNSIGIPSQCKAGAGANWIVSVSTQDDVYKAKRELFTYVESPYAKRYAQASWQSQRKVKREKVLGSGFFRAFNWDPLSLTSIIEIICVVFFVGQFLFPREMLVYFSLTQYLDFSTPWEYYRLLTPCFLHFGIFHIAFNLVMWEALARPIERTFGKARLFTLFFAVGIISNVLQLAFLDPNAVFGGLSGVVYGVIGYAGILSYHESFAYRINIPRGLLSVSILFVLLGFVITDTLANFCHLGGLIVGVLLGMFELYRYKRSLN